MKKFIAAFLCMVMMMTMIPSFFASAKALPAEEAAVVAMDDNPANPNTPSRETEGILTTIQQFIQLWSGLFEKIIGPVVMEQFGPALKKVLNIVPLGQFFQAVKDIFSGIKK